MAGRERGHPLRSGPTPAPRLVIPRKSARQACVGLDVEPHACRVRVLRPWPARPNPSPPRRRPYRRFGRRPERPPGARRRRPTGRGRHDEPEAWPPTRRESSVDDRHSLHPPYRCRERPVHDNHVHASRHPPPPRDQPGQTTTDQQLPGTIHDPDAPPFPQRGNGASYMFVYTNMLVSAILAERFHAGRYAGEGVVRCGAPQRRVAWAGCTQSRDGESGRSPTHVQPAVDAIGVRAAAFPGPG